VTNAIHDRQPGDAEEHRYRSHPDEEQHDAGTEQFHHGLEATTDKLPDDAAGSRAKSYWREMQAR
jgi:hypothetical protein